MLMGARAVDQACAYKGGEFQKLSYRSEILGMTSEGLAEIFIKVTLQTCVPR